MASKQEVPQTGVNPNKAGTGGNKGDLKAGDIVWIKPPTSGVNASDDGPRATLKAKLGKLSPARRKKALQAAAKKVKRGA